MILLLIFKTCIRMIICDKHLVGLLEWRVEAVLGPYDALIFLYVHPIFVIMV